MSTQLSERADLRGALAGCAVLLAAFGVIWGAYLRPDPGAVPGAQAAAVLLLTADSRLEAPISTDADELALRAALLRRTWDPSVIADRAARLPAPTDGRTVPILTFVADDWQESTVSPKRASLVVAGRYTTPGDVLPQRPGRWRVELLRGEPNGAARGWRLVQITTLPRG